MPMSARTLNTSGYISPDASASSIIWRMTDDDADLRALLETLDPKARDDLRPVLIHDQADRDAIASRLLRYRDAHGDDWADIIDMLTMYPEARRRVVRLLGDSGVLAG